MFVRPLHPIVRDPENPPIPLPADGREVPRNAYWLRRLAKADVELVLDTEARRAIENALPEPED
jgi:hypothetical protein